MNKLGYKELLQIKGNGRVIYIIGKYRADNEENKRANILHAQRVACRLWELGWIVLTPHLNTAHFELYTDLPNEVFLKGGLELMRKCANAVFVLDNWGDSDGSRIEFELARELGLDIYYEDSK